jgi:pimeloyl-ACP methyl ester carboxylesterase
VNVNAGNNELWQREDGTEMRMIESTTTFLDLAVVVDGVRLACRRRGAGDPVVFLHGTPSHAYIWRNVVPAVEAQGYGVITYDLLGYGESERPVDRDTSVAGQAVLLEQLLDHFGVERFTLVAHDIGGAIAQIFGTAHPERLAALILLDTVSYDSWPSQTWREIIRNHLDTYAGMPQDEFEAIVRRQLEMTVVDPANMAGETLEAYLAPHRSAIGRASFFEHQVRHYDSTYTERLVDRLDRLTMPVRILWGAEDRWQPMAYAKRLASDIPGSELVIIPEAGHFVIEDAPERVTEEILDVLSRMRA